MKLDYISARGDKLPLVSNSLFELTNFDGQTMAQANLFTDTLAGMDGDIINGSQLQPRSIVFDLRIKSGVDVAAAKHQILQIIKIKQTGTLEWRLGDKALTISGIVEKIEMPRWANNVTMQVTMHCSQPCWQDYDVTQQQISGSIDRHYFTTFVDDMLFFKEEGIVFGEYDDVRQTDIHNNGDVAVGMDITIAALDTVTNPVIYDDHGNFLGIGHGTGNRQVVLQRGDYINISTHKGNKDAYAGDKSFLAYIKPKSTWLQLNPGNNSFTIDSDDESTTNMRITIEYKRRYI